MNRRGCVARAIFGLLGVALAACGHSAPPAPSTASDLRIVALSPAVGQLLSDLGMQSHIVGRHGWDTFLPHSLPVCGNQIQIDAEALLRVRPTHVLTQWGTRELPQGLRHLAASHGWVLADVPMLSLDDVTREVRRIDALLHPEQPLSKAAADALQRLEHAAAPRPHADAAGRVLLLGSVSPPAALGPGSCHADLLTRMGYTLAIASGQAWQELSIEDVRLAHPDVILAVLPVEGGSGVVWGADARARLGALQTEDLPALREDRVVVVDDPRALLPSTTLADFAEEAARGLAAVSRPAAPMPARAP